MNLSGFSIRRPVTVLMIVVAMLIFGFVSFPKMAVDLYPELNLPVAVVVTSVDGGTPEEVETLVTRPIEEALASVANVDTISSFSISGASQVIVLFNWGTDIDQGTLDMRDRVDMVRGALPDSAHNPRIMKFDPNSMPVMTLGLSGAADTTELKSIAEDIIKPRLERIDGVASIGVNGGRERIVDVTVDPAKLQTYGITLDQISQAIAMTNIAGSAGSIQEGDQKYQIRVLGEYEQIRAIADTPIRVAGGSILLRDIATVEDTYRDITQLAYLNGEPSIGLSVTQATGGNTVEVADKVHEELEKLRKDLSEGIEITVISDNAKYIKDSISTVAEHAVIGLGFAVIVLFIFLNSARSTLVASIVIPISIVATFTMMYFSGQTINMMSLAGLLLGLGALVDYAVVILENIFRQRQLGKGMLEAALDGSKQVGNAVIAAALAQIVVFLPIVFVDGIAAELFGPLALTVIFSHIAALIVSMLLVPMLSSRWFKEVPDESAYTGEYKGYNPVIWFNRGFERLSKAYGRVLEWALEKRKTVLAVTAGSLIGSVVLFPFVGMEFIPAMDEGQFSVSVEMPTGTVLEETERAVAQIEEIAREIPELDLLYTSIGSSGGPDAFAVNTAHLGQITGIMKPLDERSRSTAEIVQELREKVNFIPDAEVAVDEMSSSGHMAGAPIQVNLRGDDLDVLQDISEIMAGEMRQVEGTYNVETSIEATQEEFQIVIDQQRASQYGLTTSQIISAVRTGFDGQNVTTYRTGSDEIDVRLKMPSELQSDKNYLERYRMTTPQGANIALSSVADIKRVEVPQTIQRTNQTREVQITSQLAGRDLGSVTNEIRTELSKINLPDGYEINYGGQDEQMMESFTSLGFAMLLAIVLMYMVMAAQFESLFTPFVIMFSVPPTLIGVVVGLLITGHSLSVMALVGYILLIGIVVNNAILLIDFVNQMRAEGVETKEALITAGPIRLRPILMTTVSTILAILPLAFGSGEGSEAQAPMAIVVAFGLSFSTLVTLVLVPVVYSWFTDLGVKRRNRKNRKRNKGLEADQIQA